MGATVSFFGNADWHRGYLGVDGVEFAASGDPCVELGQLQSGCIANITNCTRGFTFSMWIAWDMYNIGTRYVFNSQLIEIFTRSSDSKLIIAIDDRISKRWIAETWVPSVNIWTNLVVIFDPTATNVLTLFLRGCQLAATNFASYSASKPYLGSYGAAVQEKVMNEVRPCSQNQGCHYIFFGD